MDQQDCIVLIKDLPPKLRKRCIKLYKMIAANIIDHPNERKYKFLHYDKIWKKFNETQAFIDLMIYSGFKRVNKSKSILVFNIKYLHLLQQSITALQSIDNMHESNKNIINNDKFERNRLRSNQIIIVNHDELNAYSICGRLYGVTEDTTQVTAPKSNSCYKIEKYTQRINKQHRQDKYNYQNKIGKNHLTYCN